MIFDWGGLQHHRHFILQQIPDPLKYCNYALPILSPIGLPFMPCDLPNQYELISSDEAYQHQGDIYLKLEEEVPLLSRILFPASHRPWNIVGKDYYHHTPYMAIKETNCCLSSSDRPTIKVYYQEKYVGKVVETTILNCCCLTPNFQVLEVYNESHQLEFRVMSKNPQRGHFVVLPCCGFSEVVYEIEKVAHHKGQTSLGLEEETDDLMEGLVVGEIRHLFNGFSEYTSKNDKYGITFPLHSSEEEKCLLVYTTLMIDYLLFKNL